MLRAVAIVIVFATPAFADPDTLESARRELALDAAAVEGAQTQAFVQLGGGAAKEDATADAAVGAEYRIAGRGCDRVRLGGQARVAWSHGAEASAEQWASVCGFDATLEIGHHFEWDVRSSLLAAPQLRGGKNRRETVSVRWRPADVSEPEDPGVLAPMEMSATASVLWSANAAFSTRQTFDLSMLKYTQDQTTPWGEHLPFTADLLTLDAELVDPMRRSMRFEMSAEVWLLHLENIHLGPVYASGGIGLTVPGKDLTYPRATLGVAMGNGRLHGHVRANYEAGWAPDGYLSVDARLTSGVGTRAHGFSVALDGALAHTRVVPMDGMETGAITGGASLSASRRISEHLAAAVLVDAARTFYASDETRLDFTPRWAARAFATLQATLGR